jgi:uncharacterized protein (DUF927 family)
MPMAAKLLEDGQTARAGQQVRVIEIQADAGAGMGVFESLPPNFASAAALAEHLRDAADFERGASPQCGHAARSFLEQLTRDVPRWSAEAAKLRDAFVARYCPKGADGQVRRVCGRFALVAAGGTLATRFGVTGWAEEDAMLAAAQLFHEWIEQRGGAGKAEIVTAIRQVRLFLEQHGESRFSPVWDRTKTHVAADGAQVETVKTDRATLNRAGFRRAADGGWRYYVLPEVWRAEICKGLDPAMVARALAEAGWLERGEGENWQKVVRIPGETMMRVYSVLPGFMTAKSG